MSFRIGHLSKAIVSSLLKPKMKPQIYIDYRSPPVRSVLLLVEALKIDIEQHHVDLFKGGQYDQNFLKINPVHTVPVLKDDTVTLTDSHAILIYLCEKYGKDNKELWPADPIERLNVLNKLFYSGTVLFRRDSDLMGGICQYKWRKEVIHEEQIPKIREQYDFLERFLSENEFIAANHLTIADLSVVTLVSTTDMIVPVTHESWPKLHNWWRNRMEKQPYYQKCNENGLIALKNIIQQCTDFPVNFS